MSTAVAPPATGPPSPDDQPPRRRSGRTATVVVLAVAALGVGGFLLRPGEDPREVGGVAELEEPFPGLRGEAVTGPPIDTGSMEAAVLVVNVWATWCEPCRREQPALQRVQAAYAGRGVEFVGLDYNDDRAAARRWIEDFEVTYPSLYDPQGRTAATLGFPFLPDTYLVAGGTIRYAIYGETTEAELSGLLDGLLADDEVA
jgi:cytochrome c biogenesis protein CcmG, thiol:disulfide interchange protein DsbE